MAAVVTNRRLEYLWRTSLTLLRMSIQHDGSPVIIGFRPYQGNVWVRDSVWIAATLAMTGHQEEALQIMRRMRTLVKTQADGSFHFSYNCSMELPTDHTVENDTMGLLLYGIWSLYHTSGDTAIVEEFASFLEYCADWIPASIDETGMVRPCAGISEVFGPHLERQFEHMMWTSSLSAFALEKAAEMMAVLGKPEKQRAYLEASQRLVEATVRNTAREGVLYRSLESRRLDASALLFFQQLPLSYYRDLMAPTVRAINQKLVDPFLGGVWRHDELVTEEGDLKPWIFYTFALAEAYLAMGDTSRAWELFRVVLNFSSHCGLLPELAYSRELVRGIAMPSLSQCGYLRFFLAHVDWERGCLRALPPRGYFRLRGLPYRGRLIDAAPPVD